MIGVVETCLVRPLQAVGSPQLHGKVRERDQQRKLVGCREIALGKKTLQLRQELQLLVRRWCPSDQSRKLQ